MAQKGEYFYQGLAGKTAKNYAIPGIRWKDAVRNILMWIFCFLMGRAVIFNEIAPLVRPCWPAYCERRGGEYSCWLQDWVFSA